MEVCLAKARERSLALILINRTFMALAAIGKKHTDGCTQLENRIVYLAGLVALCLRLHVS